MEEISPTFPYATQESDGESSSSAPQDMPRSQATAMQSGSSHADEMPLALNTQLVKSDQGVKTEYDACLAMSVHCLRFLLHQGLECCASINRWEWELDNEGNFIELFKLLAKHNEDFKKAVLENALERYQIKTLEVQKNLISACAKVATKFIVQDLGDDYFGILVDWSCDKFDEHHLSLYLRYVDKRGMVLERFLGIVGVDDFTAVSCKAAIHFLLIEHSLSPCKIRGQSYNGANHLAGNLNCDINGLKTLITKDSQFAYHCHCFSHQLHFTLANAARKCDDCFWVFMQLADLVSLVRVFCTQEEMLQETKAQMVLEALRSCELENRKYVIEEFGLQRPYDSWEYDHYNHFACCYLVSHNS